MSTGLSISPVSLPPNANPGRTLAEFQQNMMVWTRQAQQAIKSIHTSISGAGVGGAGGGGAITLGSLSASAPLVYAAGHFSIPKSDATHDGYLAATDWGVFNAKVPATRQISTTAPLAGGGDLSADRTLSIPKATGLIDGYLAALDWTTFNNKQNALSFGNLTETTSSILTIVGGTGSVIGSGLTIAVTKADATHSGYLSFTDWNTFNTSSTGGPYVAQNNGTSTNQKLYDGSGNIAFDAGLRLLYFSGAGAHKILDLTSGQFFNTAGQVIIDATATALVAPVSGNIVVDWGAQQMFDNSTGNTSVDWTTRRLLQSDGVTVSLDWSSGIVVVNPMTLLGDMIYGGVAGVPTALAGNTTAVQRFLSQTGTGAVSAAPEWSLLPVQNILLYYFQNTASDVATYFKASQVPYSPKTTLTYTGISTSPLVLANFITEPTNPNVAFLPAGTYLLHIHAANPSPGNVYLWGEFWETTSAGVDIAKIGITETTLQVSGTYLQNTEIEYEVAFVNDNTYSMSSVNSRVVLRLYGQAAGGTRSCQVYVGGTADTHIELPSSQASLTLGNLTEATSAVLTITGGTGAVIGTGASIQVTQADSTHSGYLSSTDWNTFNSASSPITVISSNTTYYVDGTNGNDSNAGTSAGSGHAWKTIQHAVNVISSFLIKSGAVLTIQLADGTYSEAVTLLSFAGGGSVSIKGNTGAPANVSIQGGSNNAVTSATQSPYTLTAMTIQSTSAAGVVAQYGGIVTIGASMIFGPCSTHQVLAQVGGSVNLSASYTISGNASYHASALWGGTIAFPYTGTVTLSGTPSYSGAFVLAQLGMVFAWSITFSGSGAGIRYIAKGCGAIDTSSGTATYFPGNASGYTQSGGQYI